MDKLKAEMKKVTRHFQPYTHDQRADRAASHRLKYLQRQAIGEFFYVHPALPNIAHTTRKRAALAGLSKI